MSQMCKKVAQVLIAELDDRLAAQGVGLLHTALTVEETAAGQLVQPFDTKPLDEMSYYIVYLATSSNESRVAGFRDWLIANVNT